MVMKLINTLVISVTTTKSIAIKMVGMPNITHIAFKPLFHATSFPSQNNILHDKIYSINEIAKVKSCYINTTHCKFSYSLQEPINALNLHVSPVSSN